MATSIELKGGTQLKAVLRSKGINIPDEYLIKVWDNQIEFVLTEEDNESRRVFGGGITVSGYIDWDTKRREIKLNKGSMGSFDMTCTASVKSYLLMATLIQNFEVFSSSAEVAMESFVYDDEK